MKCLKCIKDIPNDAVFCPYCGRTITLEKEKTRQTAAFHFMFPHIDCDEFRNLFNEKESGSKDKNEQAEFEEAINKIGDVFENRYKTYMYNLLGKIMNEKF